MQLCDLKRRFLLAIGLPLVGSACATSGTVPAESSTKVQEVSRERAAEVTQPASSDQAAEPPSQPVSAALATAPIGRCGFDQVREQLCGQGAHSGSSGCPATGEHLTAFGRNLIVSGINIYARDGALRTFVFDQVATDAYRHEVSLSRPDLDLSRDCCYARCQPMKVAASAPKQIPPGMVEGSSCVPVPEGGTRFPAAGASQCPAAVEIGGAMRPYRDSPIIKGQCCYSFPQPMMLPRPRGRAARIDGAPHVSGVTTGRAWRSAQSLPRVEHLDDELRARLAARWLQDAQMEHASIAAFARTSMELLAFGAPPELLIAVHEAALDEITHASVTFALASAYAGRDLGPQPFHEVQRMTPAADWATFARETLVDGCIGETVAAVEAAEAAQGAEDPVIREALRGIAEDEARHAELAWKILEFALRRGGAEVAAVARAAWMEIASRDLPKERGQDADLAAHGILGDATSTYVRAQVLSSVVQPCLEGLLTLRSGGNDDQLSAGVASPARH